MRASNAIGRLGENEAVSYLQAAGHKILCRNYRIPGAEIDILSVKDHLLYIIEVKASKGMDGEFDPLERVDGRKIMRMKKAAGRYLSEYPALYYTEMRLAFITVEGLGRKAQKIEFIDGSD
jgi:putative endonuclease